MQAYTDRLLRSSVVVEDQGGLWLVPRSQGGWQRRQRLTLSPEARVERLSPARGIDLAWLGIAQDGPKPIMKAEPAPVETRRRLLTT